MTSMSAFLTGIGVKSLANVASLIQVAIGVARKLLTKVFLY